MTMLNTATQISLILFGATTTLGIVMLLILMVQIRRIGREAQRQLGPLAERGKAIASNLEYVSERLKRDVEMVDGSVKAVTDRLYQASDHMEDRIQEFNALMEVVQGEAEGVFLDTAATVRGLKAGAGRLRGVDPAPPHEEEEEEEGPPPSSAHDTRERTA